MFELWKLFPRELEEGIDDIQRYRDQGTGGSPLRAAQAETGRTHSGRTFPRGVGNNGAPDERGKPELVLGQGSARLLPAGVGVLEENHGLG